MAETMVKAVVVRGSYDAVDKDGNRRRISHTDENREVDVPERHLKVFAGVLVPKGQEAAVEAEIAANERSPVKPTPGVAEAAVGGETLAGEAPGDGGASRKRGR